MGLSRVSEVKKGPTWEEPRQALLEHHRLAPALRPLYSGSGINRAGFRVALGSLGQACSGTGSS